MPPETWGDHPRLLAARPDLAAEHLRGRVEAARYVAGAPMHVVAPLADLRRAPRPDAPLDTQALFGDAVACYEHEEGWAWVQLARDGYVGYMPAADLRPGDPPPTTHVVTALRTFVYPRPDLKAPVLRALPLAAACAVVDEEGAYARLEDGGYVFAAHLGVAGAPGETDFVSVAERCLGVPYLWGGASPLGLDCSGLVQLAMRLTGRSVPRDADMQEATVGTPLTPGAPLRRGDLAFWPGHVGILQDEHTLLHANAHHMLVASEPFTSACARISAREGGSVRSLRRSPAAEVLVRPR